MDVCMVARNLGVYFYLIWIKQTESDLLAAFFDELLKAVLTHAEYFITAMTGRRKRRGSGGRLRCIALPYFHDRGLRCMLDFVRCSHLCSPSTTMAFAVHNWAKASWTIANGEDIGCHDSSLV